MDHYTPRLKVTKVLWDLPEQGWVKVNTDGVSRGNPDRSSIGFVLRDREGDMRYARGKKIHEVTNTEAEASAILEALRYCVHHGYTNILVKTDSILMKIVIEDTWIAPWTVAAYVEEIKEVMGR